MLVGVGAAVGEEDLVQIARGVLGDEPSRFRTGRVGVLGSDRAELGRLLLHRGDDSRVLMTDVGVDQLRGEVE